MAAWQASSVVVAGQASVTAAYLTPVPHAPAPAGGGGRRWCRGGAGDGAAPACAAGRIGWPRGLLSLRLARPRRTACRVASPTQPRCATPALHTVTSALHTVTCAGRQRSRRQPSQQAGPASAAAAQRAGLMPTPPYPGPLPPAFPGTAGIDAARAGGGLEPRRGLAPAARGPRQRAAATAAGAGRALLQGLAPTEATAPSQLPEGGGLGAGLAQRAPPEESTLSGLKPPPEEEGGSAAAYLLPSRLAGAVGEGVEEEEEEEEEDEDEEGLLTVRQAGKTPARRHARWLPAAPARPLPTRCRSARRGLIGGAAEEAELPAGVGAPQLLPAEEMEEEEEGLEAGGKGEARAPAGRPAHVLTGAHAGLPGGGDSPPAQRSHYRRTPV